jgi:hypothetical protein
VGPTFHSSRVSGRILVTVLSALYLPIGRSPSRSVHSVSNESPRGRDGHPRAGLAPGATEFGHRCPSRAPLLPGRRAALGWPL